VWIVAIMSRMMLSKCDMARLVFSVRLSKRAPDVAQQ
jgi:hypothetical protein